MSEERHVAQSSEDGLRRALSPRLARCPTKNWLNASTWKESAYLAEPTKRNSPTSTPSESIDPSNLGDSAEYGPVQIDETPLDFSMKKRKSTNGTGISRRDEDILTQTEAASNYGLMKAFLERRPISPHHRRDVENLASVPTITSNLRGGQNLLFANQTLSLAAVAAAAAAAKTNAGNSQSLNANRRHYFTQQLFNQKQGDDEEFDHNHGQSQTNDTALGADGGSQSGATPPAFMPAALHSPQNGHQHTSNRNHQQNQKIQRPFKAYNPMDPMSALQVGAALGSSTLPFLRAAFAPPPATSTPSPSSPHPFLSNPLTSPASNASPSSLPPILNAQLLSQYRQYLINAQAAAAVAALRAKSNQHVHQQLQQSSHRQMQRPQSQQPQDSSASVATAQIISDQSSQSPPQVTSTSHPHTAESSSSSSSAASPPSPNITATAISTITPPQSTVIRKTSIQQFKPPNGNDRRISSGSCSGSGGSSFNGGEEDDEEILHDEDDGISNRTSPTPSCASSTAPRRASNGDANAIGLESGGLHKNGANGTSSKGEHGTNGVSTRRKGRSLPESLKDDAYWERRRKNNEAAKRSRDARRAKEDEIAIRAALLEQENMRLRIEVAALKAETDKLRQMLLNT